MYPEWVSEFKAKNTSVFSVLNSWQIFIKPMEIRILREVDKHVRIDTILNQRTLKRHFIRIYQQNQSACCVFTAILRYDSKSW